MVSTPDDGSCGIGTYTGELLQSLPSKTNIRCVTIPLRSTNPIPYVQGAIKAGFGDDSVIHIQHEYGIYGPKSFWSWLFFPILFVLATLQNKRVITTFHSAWNDETIGSPLVPLKHLYVAANNTMLAATTDHAIFLSENAAAAFRQSAPPQSEEVLPHGVQTDTQDLSTADAKRSLDITPEETLIVEPGYIRREKGCDAFVDIARAYEGDTTFLLAGGCQGDEAYCKSIRRNAPEKLQVTGVLDEDRFHSAFVAADVIVLPYREVTQSGIFNWCAAYNVPVIGSETPYFRQLADRWDCVEIVNTEDPTTAAKRVRDLIEDDDRRATLRAGLQDYRTAASMDSVAQRHVELYADEISSDGDVTLSAQSS